MSRIRGVDTKPEIVVRRVAHAMGYRFRLHSRNLPGRPDLVFARRRAVLFVHGCFWHMHDCPFGRVTPKTNADFWAAKREGNARRDRRVLQQLRKLGWRCSVIWECQTRDVKRIERALVTVLGNLKHQNTKVMGNIPRRERGAHGRPRHAQTANRA